MDSKTKSQVIEQIKDGQNILITVSKNPSVDQLAAAIGFTLFLNKINKRATAVFSGEVPSTLEFLKPEDTLETDTNSLRDFIVSLDKSKADKLRYKVEDDVVRIFITPYRTHLSEEDLRFTQGDFNVDTVVTLGVEQREDLDQAISNHGRILHDATIISFTSGEGTSDVGGINWRNTKASSLCEMVVVVCESLKSGAIDEQIATALLTGIVAETDRFSNEKTRPKTMTVSAQLMSAGANQQLVAEELAAEEVPEEIEEFDDDDEDTEIDDDSENDEAGESDADGVLRIKHPAKEGELEPPMAKSEVDVDEDSEDEFVEEEIEDQHIGIDDDGAFNNSDQLKDAVDQVQANSDVADDGQQDDNQQDDVNKQLPEIKADHKTAEYMATDPTKNSEDLTMVGGGETEMSAIEQGTKSNFSKYVSAKPMGGSPLNSNDHPDDEVQEQLDAEKPVVNPVAKSKKKPKITESPLLSTQHDAESPRAIEVPSTKSSMLTGDGVTKPTQSLGPNVKADDTLSKIEDQVEKFEGVKKGGLHKTKPATTPPPPVVASADDDVDAEAARKAIDDAMASSDPKNQNFGAMEASGSSYMSLEAEPAGQGSAEPVSGVELPGVVMPSNLPEDSTVEAPMGMGVPAGSNTPPPDAPPPIMPPPFTPTDTPPNGNNGQLPTVQ